MCAIEFSSTPFTHAIDPVRRSIFRRGRTREKRRVGKRVKSARSNEHSHGRLRTSAPKGRRRPWGTQVTETSKSKTQAGVNTANAPPVLAPGLHKMRQLAADPALRSSITADDAVNECLFGPPNVVRQAKTSGEVGGCPFRRGSLFILQLGSASKGAANRDLVFLSQSWSRCPAEKWVPALLGGVWTRVSATLHESQKVRSAGA